MKEERDFGSTIPAATGAVAGGVITSSAAMTAAGGGAVGASGYLAGVGSLIAHAGCEAAALAGLGTVFAGPIIGGLIGFGVYKGVKKAVSK